jgi:hypothetical protein
MQHFCDLLSFNSGRTDEDNGWLNWPLLGNPPKPTDAEVMFDTEEGDYDGRPLTQAELDSVVYPDAPWELHMEFDDRAIKEDSFIQLRHSSGSQSWFGPGTSLNLTLGAS